MLYELLMGKTPFHSYEMKDLLTKINDGKYQLSLSEPITLEIALFLTETLQFEEKERITDKEFDRHPLISLELGDKMLQLDTMTDRSSIPGASLNSNH